MLKYLITWMPLITRVIHWLSVGCSDGPPRRQDLALFLQFQFIFGQKRAVSLICTDWSGPRHQRYNEVPLYYAPCVKGGYWNYQSTSLHRYICILCCNVYCETFLSQITKDNLSSKYFSLKTHYGNRKFIHTFNILYTIQVDIKMFFSWKCQLSR